MNDIISRQAAIEEIERHLAFVLEKYNERYGDCEGAFFDGYKQAHEHIKEAIVSKVQSAKLSAQQWIPCSKRLPEKPGKYLVTVRNGNVYAGTFDVISGKFQCAATAWMPLPEPYREEV